MGSQVIIHFQGLEENQIERQSHARNRLMPTGSEWSKIPFSFTSRSWNFSRIKPLQHDVICTHTEPKPLRESWNSLRALEHSCGSSSRASAATAWRVHYMFTMLILRESGHAHQKKDQLGTSTWNVFHRPAFLHYVAVGCEVVSRALEKDSCKCCDDCIQRGSDPTMCSKCINALRCPKTTRFLSSNLKYEVNINKTPKEVGMSALCPACRWLVSKPVMPE